jgi:hypothetical protein
VRFFADTLTGRGLMTRRSQIVFQANGLTHRTGVTRDVTAVHGQGYLDPRVGDGNGAHRAQPVPLDDFAEVSVDVASTRIDLLKNDWIPDGTEAMLRVRSLRVIPRCYVYDPPPSADPGPVPRLVLVDEARQAACQGVVTVGPDGRSLIYTPPTGGMASAVRAAPYERAVGSAAVLFSTPRPDYGFLLDTPGLNAPTNVVEVEYTVTSSSGVGARGYARLHLVPSLGVTVRGPYTGGPFVASRPYEVARGPVSTLQIALPGDVTWDEHEVFPVTAPLSHYLPGRVGDQQRLRAPLRVKLVGSWGYDCRAPYVHDQPQWPIQTLPRDCLGEPPCRPAVVQDLCTAAIVSPPFPPGFPAPYVYSQAGEEYLTYGPISSLRNFPDGVPDTTWVDWRGGVRHDGSVRDRNFIAIENGIQRWTLDGADEALASIYFNMGLESNPTPPGLVRFNRSYVSCPAAVTCASLRSRVTGACPTTGTGIDYASIQAEAMRLDASSPLIVTAGAPYSEGGACGGPFRTIELPVPCSATTGFVYEAVPLGGAAAAVYLGPVRPQSNQWIWTLEYYSQGLERIAGVGVNQTVLTVGTYSGSAGEIQACTAARGSASAAPIRAYPLGTYTEADQRRLGLPAEYACYDRVRLQAGSSVSAGCQSNAPGVLWVAVQPRCP